MLELFIAYTFVKFIIAGCIVGAIASLCYTNKKANK